LAAEAYRVDVALEHRVETGVGRNRSKKDRLSVVLRSLSGAFLYVGLFSLFCNMAMLIAPLYMLQVYDRVLTSQSRDTLVMLTILAVGLLAINAVVEVARSRMLVRIGARLNAELSPTVFASSFSARLKGSDGSASEPLRNLETVRTFLTGTGIIALFDAPWTPVYLGVIFLLHPVLGWVAVAGALVIAALAIASEIAVRAALAEAGSGSRSSNDFTELVGRNAEVVHAMGMLGALTERWSRFHEYGVAWQALASDRIAILQAIAKFVRMSLQIAILGVGAWLALDHELSPGAMVAASIIMGRALAPVELLIGQWRSLVGARQARQRLRAALALVAADDEGRTELPPPGGRLVANQVGMRFEGAASPVLSNISFDLEAGEMLGITGPSGAGKSTFARLLVGLQEPSFGSVRLDGADISTWPREHLGAYVGYLPQDVELLSGTVATNIARFGSHDSERIVAAAKLAGANDMILALPEGYDTRIGDGGRMLSGGQRQRIALARAVYGNVRLIVLDEPNANLDAEGESALRDALLRLKQQRRTVIVISHKPSVLSVVDKILVLTDGHIRLYGTRDHVFAEIKKMMPLPEVAARKPAAGNGHTAREDLRVDTA
jgi:PrtD family type I secretion system ABC transporter